MRKTTWIENYLEIEIIERWNLISSGKSEASKSVAAGSVLARQFHDLSSDFRSDWSNSIADSDLCAPVQNTFWRSLIKISKFGQILKKKNFTLTKSLLLIPDLLPAFGLQ